MITYSFAYMCILLLIFLCTYSCYVYILLLILQCTYSCYMYILLHIFLCTYSSLLNEIFILSSAYSSHNLLVLPPSFLLLCPAAPSSSHLLSLPHQEASTRARWCARARARASSTPSGRSRTEPTAARTRRRTASASTAAAWWGLVLVLVPFEKDFLLSAVT